MMPGMKVPCDIVSVQARARIPPGLTDPRMIRVMRIARFRSQMAYVRNIRMAV